MWQAEADTELTLSATPTTAVGQDVSPGQKALFRGTTQKEKESLPKSNTGQA